MKNIFIISLLTIFLASCEGDLYTDVKSFDISVEGYIEQGKQPYITLMRTLPVKTEYESFDSLSIYVIDDAVVKISVDNKVYQLDVESMGNINNPYVYTSHELIGEIGKVYTLDISYMNKHLTATTSIPKPVDLISIIAQQTENNPNSYMINASFIDNKKTKDYYKTFVLSPDDNNQFLSSFMGNFDDDDFSTDTIDIAVLKGRSIYNNRFSPLFKIGESVSVKFCHIEEDAFHFWNEYEKALYFSRNPIFSTRMNIPSNITGGLGYWFGYGSTYYNLMIE